jgi:phage-related baseplate assembly protein|tara:strand:+ start:1077 stop:1307 length:231 start_codon:yes stop_codon:yes gene_type:complete
MSVPAPNNREDAYVLTTVIEELNSKKSRPLPEFAKSVKEAAWIRFRVDAILEEWLFSKTGEKIPDPAGFYYIKSSK